MEQLCVNCYVLPAIATRFYCSSACRSKLCDYYSKRKRALPQGRQPICRICPCAAILTIYGPLPGCNRTHIGMALAAGYDDPIYPGDM